MRARSSECDEATASLRRVTNSRDADKSGVERNSLRSCCRYQIDRSRGAMRMRTLHVHNVLIFHRLELGQVRVYCCRPTSVHVHMEKGSIEHGEEKCRYCDAGCQLSHVCHSN